ncbi:unnamed protein product [Phaeothamnion confervicola]
MGRERLRRVRHRHCQARFCCNDRRRQRQRRCCDKLMNSLWEWCIPHMLNCACVQAFGSSQNPAQGAANNAKARRVIGIVRSIFERVNKSKRSTAFPEIQQRLFTGQPLKLVNAQPQRWVGTASVLERVIMLWPALELYYLELPATKSDTFKPFPLTAERAEVLELYSLLKPVAEIIRFCQSNHFPTGAAGFVQLTNLLLLELNDDAPLPILIPQRTARVGGPADVAAKSAADRAAVMLPSHLADASGRVTCEHWNLTETARETREKLREAIWGRFFAPRYDETCATTNAPGTGSRCFLFEMQAFLHPDLADMRYVDKLASSPAHADAVKKKIRAGIHGLLTQVFAANQAAAAAAAAEATKAAETAAGEEHASVGQKRKATIGDFFGGGAANCGSAAPAAGSVAARSLEVFGPRAITIAPFPYFRNTVPPEMAAEMNLRSYEGWAGLPAAPKLGTLKVEDALDWWNKHGVKQFPELYVVIRTVLAAPASSGSLERDFCMAGRLIRPDRSSLKPRHVEMSLFLNANIDAIPALDRIPALSAEAAEEAVPVRLRDPAVSRQRRHCFTFNLLPMLRRD